MSSDCRVRSRDRVCALFAAFACFDRHLIECRVFVVGIVAISTALRSFDIIGSSDVNRGGCAFGNGWMVLLRRVSPDPQ